MTTSVHVGLGKRAYDVVIGSGLLGRADQILGPLLGKRRPIIITDTHVAQCQLAKVQQSLGAESHAIILPPGEASKSWSQLEQLLDTLLDLGVERNDHLIALGGGVIGDLVGFASSILKRGCRFIQIPTTLLAQVDSSVGGKTAINVKAGKNLIGSFHQPSLVVIDPHVLDSLPDRQMRAGYAEIVKYGLINDAKFFEWCCQNASALLRRDENALITAIAHSVRTKAAIVEADERETDDQRALLNLGHTFGHALEAATGFSERLLHGEAVAAGMALAYRYSAAKGLCSRSEAERVVAHVASCGLPTTLKDAQVSENGAELVGHMLHDKKMARGTLPFILARGIGKAYVDRTVSLTDVAEFLDAADV